MSCVSSPTATEYTTITTYTTSTSLSQSVGSNQATVTTIVQQTCIATGTLSGSATGCVSSSAVTQVNTIGGGSTTAQVPVVVTVSVTETQPTKTLYATCSNGSTQAPIPSTTTQTTPTSTALSLTTSVLVQSTPPPTIITQESSTTLSNGDVVATTIVTTSTLPPSSIYVASTIGNPSATSTQSGSGTNIAPIVGGVVGGFVGLIVIVSALWYFCRKRTSWDDIFEREEFHDEEIDYPIAVRRERDRNKLDLGTEPKPYQYGLVGHVTPPPGSGPLPSTRETAGSHRPSFTTSMASGHSRNTSITPLLGAGSAPANATRPSTSGSMQVTAQPTQRPSASAMSQSSAGPRNLSLVSTSSSAPLIDDSLERTGSPVSVIDRRVLQIINDAPVSSIPPTPSTPTPSTPTPSAPSAPSAPAPSAPVRPRKGAPRRSTGVVQHTDAGQISNLDGTSSEPPPYSRV